MDDFKFHPSVIKQLDRQFAKIPAKDKLIIRTKLDRKTVEEAYRLKRLQVMQSNNQYDASGKVNLYDQQEIKLRIAPFNGRIIMDFGCPVQWVGLSPEQAQDIADFILETVVKMETKS